MTTASKLNSENRGFFSPAIPKDSDICLKIEVFRRHHVLNDPINRIDPRGLDVSVIYYPGGSGHIGLSVNGGPAQGFYPSVGNGGGPSSGGIGLALGQTVPGAIYTQGPTPSDAISVTIHTTPEQDQKVLNGINDANGSDYNFYTGNCAAKAGQILNNAGVNVPIGGVNNIPAVFIGNLQ